MTLEEAIKHCEEKAGCNTECANEHRQLAEWLKELQVLKSFSSNLDEAAEKLASDIAPTHPDIGWDECFEKIKEGIIAGTEWMAGQGGYKAGYMQAVEDVDRMIDEKLKAAGFVIADGKIVREETK